MGSMKAKEVQQADILRLESEITNLWNELNTSTIAHGTRKDLEERLSSCEDKFKSVLAGQVSLIELENDLNQCDVSLAIAAIRQAENEIPRGEHTLSSFQALENIRRSLEEGSLTAARARHAVKDIIRHHHK